MKQRHKKRNTWPKKEFAAVIYSVLWLLLACVRVFWKIFFKNSVKLNNLKLRDSTFFSTRL